MFNYIKDPQRLLLWLVEVERRNHLYKSLSAKLVLLGQVLFLMIIKRKAARFSHVHANSRVLFFATEIYKRKDLSKMLDDASSVLGYRYDKVAVKEYYQFSLARTCHNILIVFAAFRKFKGYCSGAAEILLVIKNLIEVEDIRTDIDSFLDYEKYKLVVFRYDAIFSDNYFSQYFQFHNIQTATLQHGAMIAHRDDYMHLFDYVGIEFRGFVSDYFIAWNEFTKKEALKEGVQEDKIIVLGNIKCLNTEFIERSESNTFGIILEGSNNEENNVPMITIANQVAKNFGHSFIVRYHPNFSGSEYAHVIDRFLGTVCNKDVSILDFLKSVDFCIVCNSTVIFELPYYGVLYYRYSTGSSKDKFRDFEDYSFSDYESFKHVFCKQKLAITCSSKDIQLKYKQFFSSF